MKVLNIVGTAREGRKSVYAAEAVDEVFQEDGHETEIFDLKEKEFPPLGNRTYVEDEESVPGVAEELSEKVAAADFIVITTPEYNHSYPGVLKTALDYLYDEYEDKPFGFITVSSGGFGGIRALNHLHDIVITFGGFIGPNLPISRVETVFGPEGELKDDSYSEKFRNFSRRCEVFRKKLEEGIE
ncbi:MAG: NADPH-dependent FMN reductase [Candidatus Nanohalobium sp.]